MLHRVPRLITRTHRPLPPFCDYLSFLTIRETEAETTVMKFIFSTAAVLAILVCVAAAQNKYCPGRGGCTCNCAWANSNTCGHDDGSCCYACCCDGPAPNPPPNPPPPPPPGPNPWPPSGMATYCPSASDLGGYGGASITNQGWTQNGGGSAYTLASFNLLGGSVSFDIDVSNCQVGVNCNIYSICPSSVPSSGFSQSNYCDGQGQGTGWCTEVDWIESNGNCGGQTTLHTRPGTGDDGCTGWGCANDYQYSGTASFSMTQSFGTDGTWTTTRDGFPIGALNPSPQAYDVSEVQQQYSQYGAVVYSSQWVGWVPTAMGGCGSGPGNLGGSSFTISNLKITGTVVQGPTPTTCSWEQLNTKRNTTKKQ